MKNNNCGASLEGSAVPGADASGVGGMYESADGSPPRYGPLES